MSAVEELRAERHGRTVPLTQFLADYCKYDCRVCYGFVEGKDDPSYYRVVIKSKLPADSSIILYPSGGKENVSYIYKQIDWQCFSKKRIVFFMDRDLSCIVEDENIVHDENVYITDKYSIENEIVSGDTLEGVMRDLLGFSSTYKDEIDIAVKHYENERKHFESRMMPLMANIIMWKRNNIVPANYNNVKIGDFIQVRGVNITIKHDDILRDLFYKQSNVSIEKYNEGEINQILSEIEEKKVSEIIVRGKYIAEFFIIFCNSIYCGCKSLGIKKTHKGRTLCSRDIMETIAPRSLPTRTLIEFIGNTLEKHFDTIKS